jgi:cytochrome P450
MSEEYRKGAVFSGMDAAAARHPQGMYALLRDAGGALHVEGTGVLVSTRAAIDEVLRDPALFCSADAASLGTERPLIPLQIDPPQHKKYRRLLDPMFAPQKMKHLEAPVAQLANELIDRFAGRDEIDFAGEFSVPLPSQVVLELFGLPHDRLDDFLRMKDGMIRPHVVLGVAVDDPAAWEYQERTAKDIYAFFAQAIDDHSLAAGGGLLADLLVAEVDGERLTRNEVLDICFLMLMAGLDTVSASLDCIFAHLADHPEHRRQIVDDPSRIPEMLEELMRWESPVMAVPRLATRDTVVAGCPVRAGEHVMVMLGAGNTDEAEFPHADEIRWDRDGNRHLVFGGGIHRCLGSNLARLELRVVLREWHERLPNYRIAPGAELLFSPGVRSVDRFPMVLDR